MGTFQVKKDPTKVFIAGTGSGWEAMPRETNATVYCLNDFIRQEKYGIKPDLLFIMDVLDEKPQVISGNDNLGDVIARINTMKVPLVAPFRYEEIPLSQAFPLEQCVKEFGIPYFTNTICYMIAYALLNGAKEITIFGVNQASSHEYTEERGGVEYWIGVAAGRGVKVTISGKDSSLLRFKGRFGNDALYGYLAPYEAIVADQTRFGEQVVRKLLAPKQQPSRVVRNVNHA